MIESLLFLGELILMGAFLREVSKAEKISKRLDGIFAYKDSMVKKIKAKTSARFPGA